MMNPINVILVDDHLIVREGISMLIENDKDIKVVGEAENMVKALVLIERKRPDVVLIDLDLGFESSLDTMEGIPLACDTTRILVLTGLTDENLHKIAISKGAQGI